MWTALTLVVLATSSTAPAPTPEVTAGTRLRLSAGATVDVAGVFSGTNDAYLVRRRFARLSGLLVFTLVDGSTEAVIAPGATVTGTLVGADATYLHIRRSEGSQPEHIHRASVARAFVHVGSRRHTKKGGLVGGVAGATLLFGMSQWTVPKDQIPVLDRQTALLAIVGGVAGFGVGAAIGALSEGDDWREIRLEALPGRVHGAPGTPVDSPGDPAVEDARGWKLVVVDGGPDLTLGFARTTAGDQLRRRDRAEAGSGSGLGGATER